ncbi:penicillin-binding protein 2 [Patescibacteria group bacterium]
MSLFDEFYKGVRGDYDKRRYVKSDFDLDYEQDEFTEIESKPSLIWFSMVTIIILGVLVFRLWFLQVVQGDYYFELAEGNRIRIENTTASRGVIYDRDDGKLVQNIASFNVEILPQDLPNNSDKLKENIELISQVLKISDSEIMDSIKNVQGTDPIILKENIDRDQALILKESLSVQNLAKVKEYATRSYVSGYGLSHILGYTGKVTEGDLKNTDYLSTDIIGKIGLEGYYEKYLKGKNGKEQIEVDASGRLKRILASELAESGNNIKLSLDMDLQKKTYEVIKSATERRGSPGGIGVMMNPKNGEIYSMVSFPDFDNNIFTIAENKVFEKRYKQLLNDSNLPLFNRVISGTYPSGSTIKPVLAAAALNEGTITASTSLVAKGFIEVPNKYNPDIIYKFPDWKVHGWVDTRRAIAVSCDVFFYAVGGGYEHIKGLGLEKIREYYSKFGLGKKTGIDLMGEVSGLVPSEEWKKEAKGESWYQGDTYHISIGQGDLLTTPLQVLNFTAAVANGGELLKPHLVSEIRDSRGKIIEKIGKQILQKNIVARGHIRTVQEGMRQTVTSGTANLLDSIPVSIAAKTGTAQFDNNSKTHTWLTAYGPYDNPDVVLVVMLEGGKENGESAIPAARDLLNYYFSR